MVLLIASSGSLFAQQPQLKVTILSVQEIRLSWPSASSDYVLESAPGLTGATVWRLVTTASQVEGTERVVRVPIGNSNQFYRLRQDRVILTTITETSPSAGEGNVAVTRETILRLSAPLAPASTVGNDRFYAEFGGRKLLSRVELSSDRRTLTLFYLEPLPGRARIRVTFNGDGLNDVAGQAVDADGNGQAGGKLLLDFDTLANGGVAGTAVTGRVFASELAQAVAAHGQLVNRPLVGVRVTVDGREQDLFAVTDATGNFRLDPAPAGPFFVHIDGRTVTVPGGGYPKGAYYPFVGKEWVSRIGEEVNIGNVFLPLIQEQTLQPVSTTQDTMVTFPAAVLLQHPELNGVQLMVPANALFKNDGTRGGLVGIAPVAPDRLPGPLPPGLNVPLVITVQTDGAENFDRPVPVCFPNLPEPLTGKPLLPGARSALWSFNHDIGDWEVVGSMTVSEDGRLVCSDPGVGIRQPGWHTSSMQGSTASGGNTRGGGPQNPSRPRPGQPQECAHNDCPCAGNCSSGREVYLQSGEEVLTRNDLMIPGRAGMDFVMDRTYRSRLDYNGPVGFGWNFRYNEILFFEPNGDVVRYTGRSHEGSWELNADGSYSSPPGYFGILTKGQDRSFVLTESNGFQRFYREDGRVICHLDRFGNRMLFDYDANGNLHRVIDVFGREIQFVFQKSPDGVDRLAMIEDFTGRQVRYEYDGNGNLIHVTTPKIAGTSTGNDFPNGRTELYTYSSGFAQPELNHNMLSLTAPEEVASSGPPHLQWTYGVDPGNPVTFDRVLTETEGGINASGVAAGGTMRFDYSMLNENEPPGQLDLPRGRARITERNGNLKEYFVNERQLHIITRELTRGLRPGEPEFYETRSYYDDDGQLVRRVFPEGNETRYAYDTTGPRRSRSNLIEQRRVADADRGGGVDLVTTFTFEPLFNQILTVTEPRGNDATFTPPFGSQSASRYTKRFFYDYQESTTPIPLATLFGIDLSGVPRGLGDLNGDGRTDQMFANLVRIEAPDVLLRTESQEAARRGSTAQKIFSQTQWNDRGQMTARIDPEGNVTDYVYHPENDPDGDGTRTFSAYTALTTQRIGYLNTVTLDSRVSPRRSPLEPPPTALTTTYFYDPVGNMVGLRDPRGVRTDIELNVLNEIVTVTRGADVSTAAATGQLITGETPLLYRTRYHYDHNGRVIRTEMENRDGTTPSVGEFVEHQMTYDILNNLITRRDEVSNTSSLVNQFRYDPNELLVSTTLPEGNVFTGTYDERNLPFTITRGFGAPEVSTVQIGYDLNGNRLRVTDAADDDGDGKLGVTTLRYDGFDRAVELIDALGNSQVTVFDPASNPVRTRSFGHPPGQPAAPKVLLQDRLASYDEVNRVFRADISLFVAQGFQPSRAVSLQDGNSDGFVTSFQEYDALSRMTFAVEDDNEATELRYDGAGRTIETIDALGNRMLTQFDKNSNPVRVTSLEVSPENLVPVEMFSTHYVYDQLDRLVRATDSAGQTARFNFDSRNNLVARSDPEGAAVPDPLGLFPNNINAHGNTMVYVYDGINRLTATINDLRVGGAGGGTLDTTNPFNADGQVAMRYDWDGNSRLAAVRDDRGNQTTYTYDALNRRVMQKNADQTTVARVFNRDDNVILITDANGTVSQRSYDELSRVTRFEVTQAAPGVRGTKAQTFEYDGLSRLTRSEDDNGDVTRAQDFDRVYDSLSRVLEERQNGRVVSSAFSGDGKRLARTFPGGRRIESAFDKIDRVRAQSDSTGVLAEHRWIGQQQRELARLNGNGTMLTVLNDPGNQDIGFDAVQRTTRQRLLKGNVALLDREYGYNRANMRTSEQRHDDGNLADRYTYDSLYRLARTDLDQAADAPASGQSISYELDGTGNRRRLTERVANQVLTVSNFNVNEMNEYTAIDALPQVHSNNGNLLDDGLRTYTYDALNRLIAVARKSDGATVAEFAYDALNRRRLKTLFRANAPAQIAAQTLFFYDRWQICEEQNVSGATEVTYVHSPSGIDNLVQMTRTASHPLGAGSLFFHQNVRDDVMALTDAAGNVVEKRYYDDFGRSFDETKKETSASQVGNRFGFQGRELDAETGLYYFRNRYYDPQTGRFIQRDPVWDPVNVGNPYTFAGNGPVSGMDPFGLNTRQGSRTQTRNRPPRPDGPPITDDGAQTVTTAVNTAATAAKFASDAYDASKGVQGAREAKAAYDTWRAAWAQAEFANNMIEAVGSDVPKSINQATSALRNEAAALNNLQKTSFSAATEGAVKQADNLKTAGKAAQAIGTVAQVAEVAMNAADYYRKDERVKQLSSNERERILNEYDRLSREALAMSDPCIKEKLLKDLRENMEFQLNNVTDSQITEHLINGAVFIRDSLASFIPLPTGWLWGNKTEEAGRR